MRSNQALPGDIEGLSAWSTEAVVLVKPQDDRILDANEAVCRLLGYERRELVHTHISDIHPHDMPLMLGLTDLVGRWGSAWTDRVSCLTKRGEILPAQIWASAAGRPHDRCVAAVVKAGAGTCEAASHRPRAGARAARTIQAQPGEARARFEGFERAALYALPEATLIVDSAGSVLFANSLAAHAVGVPAARMTGLDAGNFLEVEGFEAGQGCPAETLLVGSSPAAAPQFRRGVIHRPDGVHLCVVAACSPLFDGEQVWGAVMTLRNRVATPVIEGAERLATSPLDMPPPEGRDEASLDGIVGRSPAIQDVLRRIACVASTPAAVLVSGETGTGKELVARAIHSASPRAGKAFVKVNCAAVPRELFESEFFGHVRGAFTGAVAHRAGRFESADGGTLFLDEIGELPLELQGKLLTVLQDGRFERIGETRSRQVDVRVVAATNRDLLAEVKAGRFRSDLYYRLSVFPIHLPPLRERREDIVLLARHIGRIAARRLARPVPDFGPEQMIRLTRYDWPGNVRELQNLIERAIIVALPGQPLPLDFPIDVAPRADAGASIEMSAVLTESERRHRDRLSVLSALHRARGKIGGPDGAAALIGLKPTTLRSRIKALGIQISSVAH